MGSTYCFSCLHNGKEMSLDLLITTPTGLPARWPGSHCLIPGRNKWFFFFNGVHSITSWHFNITEGIVIEYNKSISHVSIMLRVSVLLKDHHSAQKYTYGNLILLICVKLRSHSHLVPKLRIFCAVPALSRVLSRRKLGKHNIYFSPNNSSHGHVTLLF